jgi:hypothetical protein
MSCPARVLLAVVHKTFKPPFSMKIGGLSRILAANFCPNLTIFGGADAGPTIGVIEDGGKPRFLMGNRQSGLLCLDSVVGADYIGLYGDYVEMET